jgi:hypothetical protein
LNWVVVVVKKTLTIIDLVDIDGILGWRVIELDNVLSWLPEIIPPGYFSLPLSRTSKCRLSALVIFTFFLHVNAAAIENWTPEQLPEQLWRIHGAS